MTPLKRERAAGPATPPGSESPKQADLEEEIRRKKKEIEELEARLEKRRLQESAQKKRKCQQHLTSPDPIKGEKFLLDRVEDMLKEMGTLSSKELPDAIKRYHQIHHTLLALTKPQQVLPFDQFDMDQIHTLDTLEETIQADLEHIGHLRASLGALGTHFHDKFATMARKVKESEDD